MYLSPTGHIQVTETLIFISFMITFNVIVYLHEHAWHSRIFYRSHVSYFVLNFLLNPENERTNIFLLSSVLSIGDVL